jgi:hypothetical protein
MSEAVLMFLLIQLTNGPLSMTCAGMRHASVQLHPQPSRAALTAAEKRALLKGETRCTATLPLPALSPKIVTREASPPKA